MVFTPADIKGMLAEMYMYSPTEFLGGEDASINPALLHIVLTNWIGRGSHPVGMETAVGEVVINYPIFAYKSKVNKLSERQSEVQMTIRYAVNIGREMDKGPKDYHRTMFFHYVLNTNEAGDVQGGSYLRDSYQIDMLWTPLQPVQGGQEKNKRGNPHMDIKEVLAIWRDSVPEDLRKKWLNIDPTEEDRILPPEAVAAAPAEGAASTETPPATATTAPTTSATPPTAPANTAPANTTPPGTSTPTTGNPS